MSERNLSSLLMRFMTKDYELQDSYLLESEKYLFGEAFNAPRVDKKLTKVLTCLKDIIMRNNISDIEGLYAYYDRKHEMLDQLITELDEQELADKIKAALPETKEESDLKNQRKDYETLKTVPSNPTPTPPRIEREASRRYQGFSGGLIKAAGYKDGALAEINRAAPVVKALERSIGIIESECDDQELITELKQILETYKSDL